MKKIVIVCSLDGFANSVRPLKIKSYLYKFGFDVILADTTKIFGFGVRSGKLMTDMSGYLLPRKILLYFVYLMQILIRYLNMLFPNNYLFYYLLKWEMNLRSEILTIIINKIRPNFIICESQQDSLIVMKNLGCKTLFDCPTPWADELFFGGKLSTRQYILFRRQEIGIYKNATFLSFHWQPYNDYVRKHYRYHEKNLIILNGGCEKVKKRARFNRNMKIVYLGYLGGYWTNLELLSKLTEKYGRIYVYGSPAPDEKLNLNYHGYVHTKILSKFNAGLITITDDRLRSEGFSAKHLEYLSYGLPVLVPEWRKSSHFLKGTITYTPENFLEKIYFLSDRRNWTKLSNDAYEQAQKMTWDKVLSPLLEILNEKK